MKFSTQKVSKVFVAKTGAGDVQGTIPPIIFYQMPINPPNSQFDDKLMRISPIIYLVTLAYNVDGFPWQQTG